MVRLRYSLNQMIRCTPLLILSTFVLLISFSLSAKTIFEGYYKILAGKGGQQQVGYVVQRYEADQKTSTYTSTYFIHSKSPKGSMKESLKAKANAKFQPLSYAYTSQVNQEINGKIQTRVKTIDAQFKNGTMIAQVNDGNRKNTIRQKIPSDAFLSTFLGYLMLSKGMKVGKKFTYKSAIAEEDAAISSGEAFIESVTPYKGHQAFRILNQFKGSQFISLVSPQAQVLHTKSPAELISTELVASPDLAQQGFDQSQKNLKILFGQAPSGRENVISKALLNPKNPASQKPKQQPPKGS